jgi:glycosyltransferase involved in cell wall biosynthesis
MTRRWGIPDEKVVSLMANGILGRLIRMMPQFAGYEMKSRVVERVHHLFSRRLAEYVPQDTDVFIGLSSFCLEAIHRARDYGLITVVDHGSMHQNAEKKLLEEEGRLHNLKMESHAPAWIIGKEDEEFHVADIVIVLSNVAKQSLILEGIPGDKIFINHCGVNLSQFVPIPKEDDGIFRVIYCGNTSPRKGVHYLLQAFTELKLKNAELLLIGSLPSSEFGKLIGKYKSSNIRFMGVVAQSESHKIYAQGSVFVLPSIADGFGMVVPQAMACGLPVIVTENVGAADVVTEGVNGFIVPIRDVNALKDRILRLYEQPELRELMSRAALAKAKSQLSWDAYGDRLIRFLLAKWEDHKFKNERRVK